jgi:hypothetical protein
LLCTKCIVGIGKGSLKNSNWGYAHADRFVVLTEGLDMFRLWAVVTDGKINLPGNLFYGKSFGWMVA